MSSSTTVAKPAVTQADPFRFGWRDVRKVDENGKEEWVQQPLTFEDVLHPMEEDRIMQNSMHNRDVYYLFYAFRVAANGRKDVRIWADMRTDWEVEEIRPHGPDVGVFVGVTTEEPVRVTTYKVKEDGATPAVVVEVTSESTRSHDLITKVDHYRRVGVPFYVIVDYLPEEDYSRAVVSAYRATPEGYLHVAADERGRVRVEALGVWVGWEDGRTVCYDAENKRILEPVENNRRADALERRSDELEHQIEDEIIARQQAEKKAKEKERELIEAEKRAADEEKQRKEVERRNADLAARLAELEAKLRGQSP